MEYQFSLLNSAEQAYYRSLCAAYRAYQGDVKITIIHSSRFGDEIQHAWVAVMCDHPEFFYVSSAYSCSSRGNKAVFHSDFIYSPQDIKTYEQQIKDFVDNFIAKNSGKKPEDILKALVNHYILKTRYAIDNTYNQDASSILVRGVAQCTGFAKGSKLVLEAMGFDCAFVHGESTANKTKQPHAWLIIKIDGQFYHFDPTFCKTQNDLRSSMVSLDYFLRSDAVFARDHFWDSNLPKCPSDYRPGRKASTTEAGSEATEKKGGFFDFLPFSFKRKHAPAEKEKVEVVLPTVNNILEFKKEFKKQYSTGSKKVRMNINITNYQGNELIKLLEGNLRMTLKEMSVYQYKYSINMNKGVLEIVFE